MTRRFATLRDYASHAGEEIGASNWHAISQERIRQFADATDDHQWIHVDPERTRAELNQPPIAHGYLTLALLPMLWEEIFHIDSLTRTINYGANKVRFIEAVPVGSRIRARVTLKEATDRNDGGLRAIMENVIEIEGRERPAMAAEIIMLLFE